MEVKTMNQNDAKYYKLRLLLGRSSLLPNFSKKRSYFDERRERVEFDKQFIPGPDGPKYITPTKVFSLQQAAQELVETDKDPLCIDEKAFEVQVVDYSDCHKLQLVLSHYDEFMSIYNGKFQEAKQQFDASKVADLETLCQTALLTVASEQALKDIESNPESLKDALGKIARESAYLNLYFSRKHTEFGAHEEK